MAAGSRAGCDPVTDLNDQHRAGTAPSDPTIGALPMNDTAAAHDLGVDLDLESLAAGYVLGVESETTAVVLEDYCAELLRRCGATVADARAIIDQARFDVRQEFPEHTPTLCRAMAAARIIRMVVASVARRVAA